MTQTTTSPRAGGSARSTERGHSADVEPGESRTSPNRGRQREEYGGFNIGAALFGWLVAVGIAALLTATLSAAGAAIGLTSLSGSEARSSAATISIVGGVLFVLVLGEIVVRLDFRGVLYLVPRDRDRDVLALRGGSSERHEGALGAEQAGVKSRPLGLVGLLIGVQVGDLADLFAVAADKRSAVPVVCVCHVGHQ